MDPFIIAATRYFTKRNIQHLTLFVTNKCDMRCRTCFVDFNHPTEEQDLTLEEIRFIKKDLGRVSILNIGGGEPFLRDDLADIIGIFSNANTIGIPTNGWQLERVISGLKRIFERVSVRQVGLMISVDGFEKTHDYIRTKGSFVKAIEVLEKVKRLFPGLLIQVNTVLCRYNYDEILDLIDFIKFFKPSHHSIFLLRGTPRDKNCILPPLDSVKAVFPEIMEKLKSYNYNRGFVTSLIARNYHKYMFDISLRTLEKKKQIIPCFAGNAALVIYANGDVSPCELLSSAGNIRTERLSAILNGAEFKKLLESIKSGKCYCTHNCNMTENILFNPKNYLRLLGIKSGSD